MSDLIAELLSQRAKYLAFLVSKVGDRALAEDLLQDALARLDASEPVQNAEAWFYRVLRNAVIDRARREQTRVRALEAFAHELAPEPATQNVCQCVRALKDELKPSYREALERIDIAGVAVKEYAEEAGITANSAAVRVHRARHALRESVSQTCGACASQGCQDCTCAG
jgi:RNA polymerase sigma factor (sigma-70 family)